MRLGWLNEPASKGEGGLPSFFGRLRTRRGHALLLGGILGGGVVAVVAAGLWGADNHPDYLPPDGRRAEERVVRIFGIPEGGDRLLIGDLAIERFHVVDKDSGKAYVADLCKGRVRDLLRSIRRDGTGAYSVVLDREGLKAQQAQIEQLVKAVAPPDPNATYLGLKVQAGLVEAFPVNYDSRLPRTRAPFLGPNRLEMFAFLEKVSLADVSRGARLLSNKRYNYLLSNTELFSYFTNEFGLKRAVFISQVQFVDPLRGARPDASGSTP